VKASVAWVEQGETRVIQQLADGVLKKTTVANRSNFIAAASHLLTAGLLNCLFCCLLQ
jgi:hypothetical protein